MEPYIVSVITSFVGYFSSRFANRKIRGILPHVAVLFFLAVIATALTLAGQWVPKLWQPQSSQLEGQWLEKYNEGTEINYAIATIASNISSNHLAFSGNAYDKSLSPVGWWRTIQARLDGGQYDYLFEGESMNNDESKRGLRKGVGGIYFDTVNHGKGYFLSIRDDHLPRNCELHKIIDEDAIRQSKQDPKAFVQKLYNDPSYFNKVISSH